MMADYIEREAAIKRFNFAVLDCLGMEPTIRAGDIIKALESIPAADVREVVRAKWELDNDKLPICSNCGEIALQRIFVKIPNLIQDVRMVKSNYCPNCGCAMEKS